MLLFGADVDSASLLFSAKQFIAEQKDYVTELDATTGDGDHWVNVNDSAPAIIFLIDFFTFIIPFKIVFRTPNLKLANSFWGNRIAVFL